MAALTEKDLATEGEIFRGSAAPPETTARVARTAFTGIGVNWRPDTPEAYVSSLPSWGD